MLGGGGWPVNAEAAAQPPAPPVDDDGDEVSGISRSQDAMTDEKAA